MSELLKKIFSKRKEKKYLFEHILCYFISKFCKFNKNKIIFLNIMNWQYACNPKYISEELLSREDCSNLDLVWIIDRKTD